MSEHLADREYGKTCFCRKNLRHQILQTVSYLFGYPVGFFLFQNRFDSQLRSVYKELHADHETGAADNK